MHSFWGHCLIQIICKRLSVLDNSSIVERIKLSNLSVASGRREFGDFSVYNPENQTEHN